MKSGSKPDPNVSVDAATVREYWLTWRMLTVMGDRFEERDMAGYVVDSITVRGPDAEHDGFRVTVKATHETAGKVIGFRYGDTLKEAMTKTSQALEDGTLAFKEDVPYAEWVKQRKEASAGKQGG